MGDTAVPSLPPDADIEEDEWDSFFDFDKIATMTRGEETLSTTSVGRSPPRRAEVANSKRLAKA